MTATTEARDLLARVPLFRELSPRSLRRLAKLCVVRHFAAGSVLIEEGGTGLGLFVLTSGSVEVARAIPGGQLHLATLGPGEVVGELALIDDRPRSASVTATTDTACLLITRNGFRELVQRDPEAAWLFVPVLADRLREVQDRAVPLADVEATDAPPAPHSAGDDARSEANDRLPEESGDRSASEETRPEAVLRDLADAQYAVARATVTSLDSAVAMGREFLDTLADETGVGGRRSQPESIRTLSSGVVKAAAAALRKGERAPETILSTFRHHLRRGDS